MKFLSQIIFKIRLIIKRYIITFKRKYYAQVITQIAQSVGSGLKVNGPSYVNSKTILGNNVNFNGMRIIGKGTVSIGDNFHSGPGCIIMSSFHN